MKLVLQLVLAALLAGVATAQVSHTCPNGAPSTVGECASTSSSSNNNNNSGNSGPSAAEIRRRQLKELNNEAIAQINAGDCDSAKITLVKAMDIDWYYGLAHYNYAICLMREGNYAGVISSMQTVLGYGGEGLNKKEVNKLIADAQAAQQRQAANDASRAAADRQATLRKPFEEGKEFHNAHKWAEAEAAYRRAIAGGYQEYDVYFDLAIALDQQNKYPAAFEAAREACRHNDKNCTIDNTDEASQLFYAT